MDKTPLNVTFDMNCIIDLELNEGASNELRKLVAYHDSGQLLISVPGIGASERLKGGSFAQNFSTFQQRIAGLANREFEILRPPFYLGLAYLDWAILGDDKTIKLERQIHEILFPTMCFAWEEQAKAHDLDPNEAANDGHKEWQRWRNHKCDTLALWCHIYYRKDVFVTTDRNFHKATKRGRLEEVGAKKILRPANIVRQLAEVIKAGL